MRRTAIFLNLLVLVLALCLPRESFALRKILMNRLTLKGECVKDVSEEALRALIAQEMPRDILALRDLAYEDPSPYLEAGSWAAERFNVRELPNIKRQLARFDVKLLLWLEISCTPGSDAKQNYVMSGRLIDLEQIDPILTCSQAKEQEWRRVCHPSGDVYEAVSFAQVEMDSFAALIPAVRKLLARLLHIPEIEMLLDTTSDVHNLGQPIVLRFAVRRNDGTSRREVQYRQQVVRLPPDPREQICSDPAKYWDLHNCGPGSSMTECFAQVPFQVVRMGGEKPSSQGGSVITLRAPSYNANYLVRAEAIALEEPSPAGSERAGAASNEGASRVREIRSAPVYQCFYVRERKYQPGVALRLGTGLPNEFSGGATLDPVALGFDIELGFTAVASRSKMPRIVIAGVLGGTYVGGGACVSNPLMGQNCYARHSRSFSTELRGQLQVGLFRVRSAEVHLFGDFGVALESLSSQEPLPEDGLHALLLGGVGLAVHGHFSVSPRWVLGATLGLMYQWRYRATQNRSLASQLTESIQFPGAAGPQDVPAVGPGVPSLWQPLWFVLGLTWASPLKVR